MRRAAAFLVPALLLLAGLAGAQPDRPQQDDPCADVPPGEREACMEEYCEEEPDDRRCRDRPKDKDDEKDPEDDGPPRDRPERPRDPPRGRDGKGPGNDKNEDQDDDQDEDQDGPERLCRDRQERCQAWKDAEGLRWIGFDVARASPMLVNYTVREHLVLESLELDTDGEAQLRRGPAVMEAGDNDTRLRIHDNPTGLISFKGADGALTLAFPADAETDLGVDGGRIHYADGHVALLRGQDLVVDERPDGGSNVTLSGFGALHLMPGFGDDPDEQEADEGRGRDRPDDGPQAPVGRDRLLRAVERGHLGAEMTLAGPKVRAVSLPVGVGPVDDPGAEVLAYDDVEVDVTHLPETATPDTPLRVEVSADLQEGRAFSMALDPDLLPGIDPFALPETLQVRYFDVENGTETEATIRMADSLDDVLDPTDDAEPVAEYWVVLDPDGIQVLFMVPTWSTHAITLATLADIVEVVTDPPILIGIAAGVMGAVGSAAFMLWPRRRTD